MGYGRFLVKSAVIYATVLFAAMTILYAFTYPILQRVYAQLAQTEAQKLYTELLRHAHGAVNVAQVKQLVNSYYQTLLSAYGLNKPIYIRYFIQMYDLLTFHFGYTEPGVTYPSYAPTNNVAALIAVALPRTILLFTTATLLVVFVGILLGTLAARYQGSAYDKSIPVIAVVHSSLPTWWIGFLLVAGLAYGLHWFPPSGMVSPGISMSQEPLRYVASLLDHMALPLLAYFIVNIGGFAYIVRSLALATTKEDFVLTAKARGLPENRIVFGHILRTASPSIATQAILAIAFSLGGGLTTEIVFVWPGMGLLTYEAVLENDLNTVMAITYVLTLVLVLALFIDEIVKGFLDPRIKASVD